MSHNSRLRVEVIEERTLTRIRICHAKEPIVHAKLNGKRGISRYPVNRPTHFPPVRSIAAASRGVIGAPQLRDFTGFVLDHVLTLDEVRVAQANFPPRCQTVESLRWIFRKIILLDVKLPRKRNLAASILRHVVWPIVGIELFRITFRIIRDDDLQRARNSHHARRLKV